jgi:hypothetical protein
MNHAVSNPDEVTPEWLTEVLNRQGVFVNVAAVEVLLSKDLPYSTVARLGIKYFDNSGADRPQTLFLKLTSAETHDADSTVGKNEVEFYRCVAPEMPSPPLVKCYDAAFSPETRRSHILMQDLFATHSQPDQNIAPSEADTRAAIKCLAKVHAHWWNDSRLGKTVGNVFDERWLVEFLDNFRKSLGRFCDFLGDELTPEQKDIYRLMDAAAPRIWRRLTQASGLTVVHGDMHWWNFLYPRNSDSGSVYIFDWHLWHLDLGARDLASLLALGGFAERRPEIETSLLRLYHETLLADGVEKYPWRDFWLDYLHSAIRNLNMPIIFWTQGKHESTWRTALDRAFKSFDELGSEELLHEYARL